MIVNIVDRRKLQHRFQVLNVIVEAAWHDKNCKDSGQIDGRAGPDYDERENISLSAAIAWASSFLDPVTLYIYDRDCGTTVKEYPVPNRAAHCS